MRGSAAGGGNVGRYQLSNLNFPSLYLPHPRKRKHDTARVDCLTRVNVCFLSAFAEDRSAALVRQ
jgi:hypothetical protein